MGVGDWRNMLSGDAFVGCDAKSSHSMFRCHAVGEVLKLCFRYRGN